MPNGGVAMYMLLKPAEGDVVLYSDGPELTIFDHDEWQERHVEARPLCRLSPDEAAVLVSQLAYWLGEGVLERGRHAQKGVAVQYDF